MLNVMEFEKEEMTPKHKANLNYGFIKYRLYDKQKEAYREEEPNSLLRVMFELDTFITDYGFFEEDNCW